MPITDVIVDLYRRGIDCGFESFRGTGLLAWVVDERNRRVERCFDIDQLDRIDEWLIAEASRQYEPHSTRGESSRDAAPRAVLAELSGSERKDPKRITSRERHTTSTHGSGTRS